MHLLATNPVALGRVHREVEAVLEGRQTVSVADLDQLHYVKCVVKEALRSQHSSLISEL